MKRRLIFIFGIGVPLGIFLLLIKEFMNIGDSTFFKNYVLISIIVIALVVIINCLYQIKFCRKVNSSVKALKENGDVDSFINQMQNLSNKAKSGFRKTILLINISYGLSKKGQYEEALQVLESINPNVMKGINRVIYNINKINFYFHLKNYEKVIEIVEENQKEFDKLKNHSQIAWNIQATQIYYKISKGNLSEAENQLEQARKIWTQDDMQEEWKLIDERIEQIKNGGI